MALILPFNGHTPKVAESAFLAPTAVLIGDVTVGEDASIWFGAVLRGDNPEHGIVIGARSNIQENCVVHVGHWGPTVVGDDVTVGHGAKFESCAIGDNTVVGMNAVILQGAKVGAACVLAAGTVVLEGADIPAHSLVAGVPGRVRKTLEGASARWVEGGGGHYVRLARRYKEELGALQSADEAARAPRAARRGTGETP